MIRIFLTITTLIIGILTYFKIAEAFNIIDKPNQRSSHTIPTIRGGGVVVVLALLLWFVLNNFNYPYFITGAVLLALISFADDVKERPAMVRFSVQFISFLLMGWEIGLFGQYWMLVIVIILIGVGTINAFNFMDGINGITGIYALVNLLTFLYINKTLITFTQESLIISTLLSILIFLYFNFRKKARCFAGDVGSITLAFVQLFILLQLIFATQNFGWILLFLLFGIDSVVTVIYRLKRKENIFKPHRTHLYQYYSNELRTPHLIVSLTYGLLQLAVNFLLVNYIFAGSNSWILFGFSIAAGLAYVVVREIVLKKIGVKGFFN